MPARLLVFEGPEGSGKSTQAAKIAKFYRKKRQKAVLLREPGGNRISEKIRNIILDPAHKRMSPKTELFLYVAARCQIIEEKLKKLLKDGNTVCLDRFYLATIVYQGHARGLNRKFIDALNRFALGGIRPSATIVYDVSLKEASKRMKNRGRKDRLEKENRVFHEKVRAGYLKEAKREPRCYIVKTDNKNAAEVFKETLDVLKKRRLV